MARRAVLSGLTIAACMSADASAQTDYYNTDAGRPVRVEDAYPTERYAFELQLAPLRLERERGGVYSWGVEPEIAYGALPFTHIELGFPLAYLDQAGDRVSGLAGIDIAILHNLNAESASLPAIGLATEAVLPLGPLAPDRAYLAAKAILTRTFGFGRVHVNASYTFGETPNEAATVELSRWFTGIAVDRTIPLKSMLMIVEVVAEQPLASEAAVVWNAGGGIRYQVSPRLAIDGGIGKRLSGPDRGWHFTFGSAYAFALRSLIPR